MEMIPNLQRPDQDLAVRIGCEIVYQASAPTPALFTIKPRQGIFQCIRQETTTFEPVLRATEFEDDHENIVYRIILHPGPNKLRYDAIATVPGHREDFAWVDDPYPPHLMPASVLRYTMPSRYCDSDKLLNFAWQQFGNIPHGLQRIHAICHWINQNIEYRTGSGSPNLSAYDIIQRGYGVCRDLAHCGVALCRTFNLPARYVSGFVPDIGCLDPGSPMDFHAYFEVYMGGRWQTFDARFLTPRTGRIRICSGYDAVNCAFSTLYGAVDLTHFEVWSYQVDPAQVRVGDPIEMNKRLCGSEVIRRPANHSLYQNQPFGSYPNIGPSM